MQVIIGMAGAGSRFSSAGYSVPKPLCRTGSTTMIAKAVESLGMQDCTHTFVVQQEHLDNYSWLGNHLYNLATEVNVVALDGVTDGAACSLLQAREFIYNEEPLISINSDQVLNWNAELFTQACADEPDTSWVMTYPHDHIKHSFVRVVEGCVVEAAEKVAISNDATVGVYHWSSGKLFCDGAEQMIADEHTHNGEYYLAPIYNYTAKANTVKPYPVQATNFTPVGTPEDLAVYHGRYYAQ